MARELGAGLAQAGVCVVSGGAGGVDTAALQGCLERNGRPVAVLGTGVDQAYPAANRPLFEQVAGQGALLSEYEPGTPGHPSRFPRRNRIISGLAEGVVVVRAAAESGSLITAREAVKQQRVLMAVPGPAAHRLSAGVHELIRRGALLVECVREILCALSIDGSRQACLGLPAQPAKLNADEHNMLQALGEESHPIDVLSSRTGMQPGRVASLLLNMELRGLVTKQPGMIYCRSRMDTRTS